MKNLVHTPGQKQRKAPKLTYNKRLALAEAHKKYPEMSVREIAQKHNVTPAQVRYAIKQHKEGTLGKPSVKQKNKQAQALEQKKSELRRQVEDGSIRASLSEMLIEVLARIQIDVDMPVKEQVTLIDKVTRAQKVLLETDISHKIRNPHAKVIVRMMRMLEPSLTKREIVEIWEQAKDMKD